MNKTKRSEEFSLFHNYICGNNEAGEKLYSYIFPILRKFVIFATKTDTCFTSNDKDDIVSEAMVRTLENIHLFNNSSNFSTYTISIAKNVIREARRKAYKDLSKLEFDKDLDSVESIDIYRRNPLDIIIDKEQYEAAYKALDMISEDHRNILHLRLLNGMKSKDVAQLIGKNSKAVDSLYYRAIKSLKRNFINIYN